MSRFFEIWGDAEERYRTTKILVWILTVLSMYLAYHLVKASERPPQVVLAPGVTESYALESEGYPESYVLDFGRVVLSRYANFRAGGIRSQYVVLRRLMQATMLDDFDRATAETIDKVERLGWTQGFWIIKEEAKKTAEGYTIRFEGRQEIRGGAELVWAGGYYYEIFMSPIPLSLSEARGLVVTEIRQGRIMGAAPPTAGGRDASANGRVGDEG